jgi:hypothetical protein
MDDNVEQSARRNPVTGRGLSKLLSGDDRQSNFCGRSDGVVDREYSSRRPGPSRIDADVVYQYRVAIGPPKLK